MTKKPEHKVWRTMRERCENPNRNKFPLYGGRGIKVCERWRESFENFYADMGPRPEGMTLDRINNDGDYCPENCRWASLTEQSRNRRNNRWIEFGGECKLIADWARQFGLDASTISSRIKRGWPLEDVFGRPPKIFAVPS